MGSLSATADNNHQPTELFPKSSSSLSDTQCSAAWQISLSAFKGAHQIQYFLFISPLFFINTQRIRQLSAPSGWSSRARPLEFGDLKIEVYQIDISRAGFTGLGAAFCLMNGGHSGGFHLMRPITYTGNGEEN